MYDGASSPDNRSNEATDGFVKQVISAARSRIPAANADNFARLPHDLETAIRLSEESQFVRSALTAGLADSYISASQREWERFSAYPDKAGYLDKVFKAL